MPTDATGTPSANRSYPKYNTSADAPSGVGLNNIVDAIDADVQDVVDNSVVLVGTPVTGDVPQYDGTQWEPVALTTTRTVRVPINLTHPNNANSFWTVAPLTAWQMGHWEYVKDVDGGVWGHVLVPANLAGTPNAKIKLEIAANATSGVTRLNVDLAAIADGESLNPGSFTQETPQDITVPATAYLRKTVSFTLTNAPSASDLLLTYVAHAGAHANDTLAVNTLMLGAWLEVDVT